MNKHAKSCAFVAENPRYVFINYENINNTAAELAIKQLIVPSWREPVYPESDDKIIEFFGVANSVNFCFTDFKTGRKFDVEYPEGSNKIWTGAFGMAMCFKRALDEGIPVLDPYYLMNLPQEDAKHIFRHKNIPIPMLQERINNLRSVGINLCRNHVYDNFTSIFRLNDFRFLDIVDALLKYFNSYYDEGVGILFNKRAQLFPMVYHGRALSSQGRLEPIRDPENFGPISDYEVPKILRHLGILYYSRGLASDVDNGVILEKFTIKEIEIRAQTVNAMSELLNKVNEKRKSLEIPGSITMAELDYAIWNMGRSPEFKSLRHHYTYTTAY